MIKIKNPDLNKIKIRQSSQKNTLICYIEHMTFKDLRYVKINIVIPLYLIIFKIKMYFEEINGNKDLKLVPTNDINEIMKNMKNCGVKFLDQ